MMKPMRKAECQTSQEEAIRILQQCKYLSVAMLNEDGSPYNVMVDCLYDDGKIYFHSANEGQKLDCIRHDPRICATGYSSAHSDAANSTTRYASVVIHGKAHILEDKERKLDICRYYYTPLVTGETAEDITLHLTYAGIITLQKYFLLCRMLHLTYPGITHLPPGGQPKTPIKTTSKLVVCTDPRRVITGRAPKGALKSLTPHYHYRPPLKRPVFMPSYSCYP